MEEWKRIKEFDREYEVSNLGRIRSWVNKASNRREKPMLRKQYSTHGYKYCNFKVDDGYKARRVHRLVAKAFIPNPENKPCVNHLDGDKTNNHVDNLEWVTHSENDIHAYENGLREPMKGEKNGHAIFTDGDILEIRRLYYEDGLGQYEIADQYDITQNYVSQIVNFKRWKHIAQEYKDMDKPYNYSNGEDVHGSKLNADKVKKMRNIRDQQGLTYKDIGKMFGVSRHTVSRAIKGETWSHVN